MKIPSIKYLTDEAVRSVKRFPLTIISAFLGVSIAVYLVEIDQNFSDILPLFNLLLVSALGLVLFLSVSIYRDKVEIPKLPIWILNVISFVILTLIYFTLPTSGEATNVGQPYVRYTIYNVIAHLLVSFVPYFSKGEVNGFWQYNKMLFLRFCLSILYSGFVYIGLTLALVSLDLLFDVDIQDETFFQLLIIVLGIFNTWFFISGVDRNLGELEEKSEYPKGLKTFTQYVLLPLLILYLVILYAYVVKIIGLWDWPKGIVSYLIICVAVLGILTFLLIYPFGESDKKHWISRFSKIYYYVLLPLTIVLFVAISIRIDDYGITVNRYLVVELGVWLAAVSLYFIFGNKNIKVIPMSLAAIVLFTSFGFWGMFRSSERSQVNRLESILKESSILVENRLINEPTLELGKNKMFVLEGRNKNKHLLNDSLQNEVYSILDYLDDYHGYKEIDDWFQQRPDSVLQILKDSSDLYYYLNHANIRMELMGLEAQHNYGYNVNEEYRNYSADGYDTWNIMKVAGYDYVLNFNYLANDYQKIFVADDQVFELTKSDPNKFNLVSESGDTLRFDFKKLISKLSNKYGNQLSVTTTGEELILFDSSGQFSGKLNLGSLNIATGDSTVITNFSGKLLIKLKED